MKLRRQTTSVDLSQPQSAGVPSSLTTSAPGRLRQSKSFHAGLMHKRAASAPLDGKEPLSGDQEPHLSPIAEDAAKQEPATKKEQIGKILDMKRSRVATGLGALLALIFLVESWNLSLLALIGRASWRSAEMWIVFTPFVLMAVTSFCALSLNPWAFVANFGCMAMYSVLPAVYERNAVKGFFGGTGAADFDRLTLISLCFSGSCVLAQAVRYFSFPRRVGPVMTEKDLKAATQQQPAKPEAEQKDEGKEGTEGQVKHIKARMSHGMIGWLISLAALSKVDDLLAGFRKAGDGKARLLEQQLLPALELKLRAIELKLGQSLDNLQTVSYFLVALHVYFFSQYKALDIVMSALLVHANAFPNIQERFSKRPVVLFLGVLATVSLAESLIRLGLFGLGMASDFWLELLPMLAESCMSAVNWMRMQELLMQPRSNDFNTVEVIAEYALWEIIPTTLFSITITGQADWDFWTAVGALAIIPLCFLLSTNFPEADCDADVTEVFPHPSLNGLLMLRRLASLAVSKLFQLWIFKWMLVLGVGAHWALPLWGVSWQDLGALWSASLVRYWGQHPYLLSAVGLAVAADFVTFMHLDTGFVGNAATFELQTAREEEVFARLETTHSVAGIKMVPPLLLKVATRVACEAKPEWSAEQVVTWLDNPRPDEVKTVMLFQRAKEVAAEKCVVM